MATIEVVPLEDDMALGCACCAPPSGLRGLVYEDQTPRAVYSARQSRLGAKPVMMSIAIGAWGKENSAKDRKTVALSCIGRIDGAEIRPTDYDDRSWPEMAGMGQPLTRSELEHDADHARVVQVARAILHQDRRIADLSAEHRPTGGGLRADGG